MQLTELEEIIKDFDSLPQIVKQPTYLELCKYPKRRFEEICSRLLCFFLTPGNEHGLGDLFLRSLFEVIAPDEAFIVKSDTIKVLSEDNAEGKRLDILIHANDFVIGIENKITARLYNPLEKYKNRIDSYTNGQIFRIVLSLKRITDANELRMLQANGFTQYTYGELFNVIKKNLGFYLSSSNPKYIIILNDFMQTLENMNGSNILNEQISNFFYDNNTKIENLFDLFVQYNNKVLNIQKERIADLKEKISTRTNSTKWWAWEGWDLGSNDFNSNRPKIGVESHFEATRGNPLGKFFFYITSWTLNDWNYYEGRVLQDFPNRKLEKKENRATLHMGVVLNDNEEEILENLEQCFNYLTMLTGEETQIIVNA